MTTKLSWLHLSDLHFGHSVQKPLWPTFKNDFYKDLRAMASRIGPLDVVFFTGDFVQAGTDQQFSSVAKELEQLWKEFERLGLGTPPLLAVPGNHDLQRPDEGSSISLAFAQWHSRQIVQDEFWSKADGEYRDATRKFFSSYTKWYMDLQVPKPAGLRSGILPGDVAIKLQKGSCKLGAVGLNSTFLQIRKGNLQEQLDLSVRQLNALCDDDPDRWLAECDIALLLTHHPVSWLAKESQAHFHREIYPPGRFFAHLYGHQHVIEAAAVSLGGAEPRRTRQAPSLFGLDEYGDGTLLKRTHGYIAGQFEITGNQGIESIWPRRTEEGLSGNLRLRADQRFDLNDEGFVSTPFDVDDASVEAPAAEARTSTSTNRIDLIGEQIDPQIAVNRLSACPQFQLSSEPQHIAIRQEEQAAFEYAMLSHRIVYIIAGWGLGKEGFIASALSRFQPKISSGRISHIRCEDAIDPDSFQSVFLQQAGLSLQAFAACVSVLEEQYLILDNVSSDLIEEDKPVRGASFRSLIQAMLDYCPKLRVIVACDTKLDAYISEYIELRPLEVPEVRAYLQAHVMASEVSNESLPLELICERTDGLPILIDRFMRRTKVTSIREALEDEAIASDKIESDVISDLPAAQIHTILNLSRNADKNLVRAFQLLKVLTVLPFGETMESVKRFFPAEPFFPAHALALNEASLLDVIPLSRGTPDIRLATSSSVGGAPKLLKVPRRVREYIKTLIGEDERKEIINAGLELCFGKRWKYGAMRMRSVPIEYQEYLDHGVGNEFALIEYLLTDARAAADSNALKRAYRAALFYARHLTGRDRYHDLVTVGGSILPLFDREKDPASWSEMARIYGTGLRMTGQAAQAIAHFEEAIAIYGERLSKVDKADVWIELSYAYEKLGNNEGAIASANKVREFALEHSSEYFSAAQTIASLSLEGEELHKELKALEARARQHECISAANNIALELARVESDGASKRTILDRVLKSEDAGYTRWRGVVEKGKAIIETGKVAEMTYSDRSDLVHAYSYLHAQRFGGFFDRCHSVIWAVLLAEGKVDQLLRLFRHSSFVWRIRGAETQEAIYAYQLSLLSRGEEEHKTAPDREKSYFSNRLRRLAELIKQVSRTKVGADRAGSD